MKWKSKTRSCDVIFYAAKMGLLLFLCGAITDIRLLIEECSGFAPSRSSRLDKPSGEAFDHFSAEFCISNGEAGLESAFGLH